MELSSAIVARGTASLAVSGGKTPARFFKALGAYDIDWRNIVVTLVDERLVPATDERSNARLALQTLMQGAASAATFVPLFAAGSAADAAREASSRVGRIPMPIDVVVLGMGGDGHTASFFPDAEKLDALFENTAGEFVLAVTAKSAGEPRLTLSSQVLGSARFIALHIEGDEKRGVLDAAISGGNKPIATLIGKARSPVEVFWAP